MSSTFFIIRFQATRKGKQERDEKKRRCQNTTPPSSPHSFAPPPSNFVMGAGIQIQRQKEELQPTCCCQPLYYYYSVVVCFVLLYAFAFFVYCRVNFVRCSFTDVSCTTTGVCEINSLKLSTWSKRYRAGHPGNEYRRLHYTSLLPQVLSLAIFSLFCMNEISHNTTSTQKPFPWHYSFFYFYVLSTAQGHLRMDHTFKRSKDKSPNQKFV